MIKRPARVVAAISGVLLLGAGVLFMGRPSKATDVTSLQSYPQATIDSLQASCKRPDIPASAMPAYCACYLEQMQSRIPWKDFLLLDTAIRVKGIGGIDAEEKAILIRSLDITFYCSQKATR